MITKLDRRKREAEIAEAFKFRNQIQRHKSSLEDLKKEYAAKLETYPK